MDAVWLCSSPGGSWIEQNQPTKRTEKKGVLITRVLKSLSHLNFVLLSFAVAKWSDERSRQGGERAEKLHVKGS